MKDKAVSVAELKAKLSEYLAESRNKNRRLVVMNRKRPVALIVPVAESVAESGIAEGLAGLAGTWPEFGEIERFINEGYTARRKEGYREIPL